MEKIRVDKWLWSIRIFKSRSISGDACKGNKVLVDEKPVKSSFLIKVGDVVFVKKNGYDYQIQVDKLIGKRVSAPLAQECYTDLTSEDELNKYNDWFVGKGKPEMRGKGTGRPTKKERREISGFKDDFSSETELDED